LGSPEILGTRRTLETDVLAARIAMAGQQLTDILSSLLCWPSTILFQPLAVGGSIGDQAENEAGGDRTLNR
jgi:hypothetical protein